MRIPQGRDFQCPSAMAVSIIGTPNTNIRSVMQRNATPEKLTEVTAHNLEALEKMVDYNIANDIRLYRISSDPIPFGSSPVNALDWPENP